MSRQSGDRDGIDERRDQWSLELPDLDTRGMAVLGRMRAITLTVRGPIEKIFAERDLDSGEFDVLATLLRSGPPYKLRPTELFRSLMISSGGLTDRLGRLAKADLISRAPAADDARSLLVCLTERGRALAVETFRADMALEAELIAALSADEQRQLEGLLRKLAHSVGSYCSNLP
ncbi:MarR family winged helix-turn-helix transcriptional regulator [Caulobacter sp.]|uniref:MarR family winged helix-turn-helix transcriptional regulator n=1 Tax=Caulobacter sp. TaxID=78 RepID=UPI003BAD9FE0